MRHTKYPKTYHLPESETVVSDDKVLENSDHLLGREVVCTEKKDGENTNMYTDICHARSIDSGNHDSRNWVKALHASIKNDIPENMRICGENLYAKHSIFYEDLESYFYVFSIWQDDTVLSWDDTVYWSELFGLITVPVIYRGIWTKDTHKECLSKLDLNKQEGYVVRLASSFKVKDFKWSAAKFVRASHVQTDEHWMYSQIVRNKLKA